MSCWDCPTGRHQKGSRTKIRSPSLSLVLFEFSHLGRRAHAQVAVALFILVHGRDEPCHLGGFLVLLADHVVKRVAHVRDEHVGLEALELQLGYVLSV